MLTRFSKAAALGIYGLMVLLAGLDNIFDYDSNFTYVQHVLSMDTVFENTTLKWRAIDSPTAHRAAFALIIATELVIAALCLAGATQLLRRLRVAASFNKAKRLGMTGLILSLALWFFGFYVVGGEWFVSWQSESWSSTAVGLRLTVLVLLILFLLSSTDSETDA